MAEREGKIPLGVEYEAIPPQTAADPFSFAKPEGPALPNYDAGFHRKYPSTPAPTFGRGKSPRAMIDLDIPGKPYRINAANPEAIAALRQSVGPFLDALPKGEQLKQALETKVDALAQTYLYNSKLARDFGHKGVALLGGLEIPDDAHPVARDVAAAVKDYNAKHPRGQLAPPPHVVISEKIGTLNSSLGILVVGEPHAALGSKTLRPLIAHELTHERQMQTGEFTTRQYSPQAHAAWAAPRLDDACAREGVSPTDVARVIPSALAADLTAAYWAPIEWREKALNAGTFVDRMRNLPETLGAYAKVEQAPHCKEEVAKVNASLGEALKILDHDQKDAMRKLELGADRGAAETYGNKAVANALIATTKGAIDREIDGREADFDHPSLDSRLKALGCKPLQSADQESAVCGPLPPKPRENGRVR